METGKGITFVIMCDQSAVHDWMSFASWYSISKNLPDAEVVVAVRRTAVGGTPMNAFCWPNKCGIRKVQYKKTLPKFDGEILEILPSVMAVRTYGENVGPSPAKSSEQTTLVDYSDGCGSFVAKEWIDKVLLPFPRATIRWATDKMSVNETALLELWQKCGPLYEALGGSR